MHILLAAATTFEIQPTIDVLGRNAVSKGFPPPLITGVGGVATTWSLMRHIGRSRPDLILQAGIGGSLAGHEPGAVFVIAEDRMADVGVWEYGGFRSPFDMGLADADAPPFCGGRLINPYRRLLAFTGLPAASALTVNEITTDAGRIAWYKQNTGAVVESMEGASLHYVCLREGVPFLQIRSVSNAVGERDKTRWDIPTAISRLNERLLQVIGVLGSAEPSILEPTKH